MEVNRGDVYEFKGGKNFIVIVENKTLTDPDDKVKVQWSKTKEEGHFYDYTKEKIQNLTNPTNRTVEITDDGYISGIDKKLNFRHECNGQVVTAKEFFSLAGEWPINAFNSLVMSIAASSIHAIAGLLATMYDFYKTYSSIKNYRPTDWFENVKSAPTKDYRYKCWHCGEKIDAGIWDN